MTFFRADLAAAAAAAMAAALLLGVCPATADTVRVYVTNSAGDSIHVIDPATNKVVQVIKGIEGAHGIGFSPDGARVYASNEADTTLDVFDRKSGKLIESAAEQSSQQHRGGATAHRGRRARDRARSAIDP